MNNKAQYFVLVVSLAAVSSISAADLSNELRACAARANATERLACFDKLADSVRAPNSEQPHGEPRMVEKTIVAPKSPATAPTAAATETEFGLQSDARAAAAASRANRISSTVAKIEELPRGRLIVTLENGQVWEQLTADRLFSLQAGEVVTIKAASFNSFLLMTSSNRFTNVKRIR